MFARTFSLEYVVLWRILLVCVSLSGITRAINYKKRAIITDKEQEYLMKFGYLSSNVEGAGALRTEESVKQALRNLQKFARLPVTGELDERTIELMSMPRCGVKDFGTTTGNGNGGAAVRRKRYVLHTGHPWQHTDLTWSLRTKNATNVNLLEAERVFSTALDVWAQNSRLTFTRTDNDRADILIYFHRGDHGDLFPFDGKGQILAHAFFPGPGKGGDAHFDMDEIWITNDRDEDVEGTDLFKVAAHEFGHSLGLAHSNEDGALMSPWYQGSSKSTEYQLPDDDRLAIQTLYGRKPDYRYYTTPTTTSTTTTRPPYHTHNPYYPPRRPNYYPPNHYPHNVPPYYPRYPTTEKPRKAPMHPGKKYPYGYPKDPDKYPARYTTKPPIKNYPRHPTRRMHYPTTPPTTPTTTTRRQEVIRHHSPDRPKPDACNTSFDAVAVIRREVFFFKDAYFWRIGDHGLISGHPAQITRMWWALPRDLTHVDAVYETPSNKIVFFIGRNYYVFSGNELEHGYPRPLTALGLPERLEKIDGAVIWGHNGKTFFFSGHEYWRFDEESKRVELDYPRNIDMWGGVGDNIDAVFQWRDGKTYFFKDKGFWKFDDFHMKVENPHQKLSGPFWFGCTHNFEENHTKKQPYVQSGRTNAAHHEHFSYSLSLVMLALLYHYTAYLRNFLHVPRNRNSF